MHLYGCSVKRFRSYQFSAHYKYTNIIEKLIEKLTELESATPETKLKSLKYYYACILFQKKKE